MNWKTRWQMLTLSASSGFVVAKKRKEEKHQVPLPVLSQFAFGGDADCKLSDVQKSKRGKPPNYVSCV